jgi:hypothetical protein
MMLADKFRELFEFIAAQGVVLVLVELVKQFLGRWKRWTGRWAAGTDWATIAGPTFSRPAPVSCATSLAFGPLAVGPGRPIAAAEHQLANRLASGSPLFVAQFSVTVLVELHEHTLTHFASSRAISRGGFTFGLLGQYRQCCQCRK